MNYQLEKCNHCCWAKMHDGKVFCPFVNDTCLKNDQIFKNAVGVKKKPENIEINKSK